MRISIREIRDYQRCPLYYKMKHIDEIPVDKTINEYFKDCFRLSLYSYYFYIIENKKKSFEAMLKRWEAMWFSSDMMEVISEADLKAKSNEAVSMFSGFYKKYGAIEATPIAVNFSYEAIFPGTQNLHVTGSIDLIQVVNDRTRRSETVLSSFNLSSKHADTFLMKNDLALSVASYAFRSSFKSKEDRIIIQNILCKEDTPTLRTGNDFERAEKAIRNIYRAIEGGVFYPAPSSKNCLTCPYKTFCLNEKSITTGGEIK